MRNPAVLISGAGVAGPTLAYWLAQHGFSVTVAERAQAQRSSGSPVDVRGPAVPVAEAMGIMPQLRAAATQVTSLVFVNGDGRTAGRINMLALQRAAGRREVELPRGDLARIVFEQSQDRAEFLFGTSIATLAQDQHGVDATFDDGQARRFDFVIGADGLHSAVRRLAFGPEQQFAQHMGVYIATMPLGGPFGNPTEVLMYNTPGKAIAIHPSRGNALAAFMFRSPSVPGFDHRDTEQHKRLLISAFSGESWQVPNLLSGVPDTAELYFDSVSQVRLGRWSQGRIALLGDAASCVSLFGDGSSLAMAGASTLANALAASPLDPATAFAAYETAHRKLVEPKQRGVAQASRLLIPVSRNGIRMRNLATRLWPAAAAGAWARRQLSRDTG